MLEMKLRDKVAGSLLGVQWERTDTSFLGQDGHVGCSMIAQKLEVAHDRARTARRDDRAWREGVGRPPRGFSPVGRKACFTRIAPITLFPKMRRWRVSGCVVLVGP